MSVKEAEPTDCPICERDDFDGGEELTDHMGDEHDAFTKLVKGEYHQ